MATITVRNLADDVVERLKETARLKGHSMEQEVRELLESRYSSRAALFGRIEERWDRLPPATKKEIDQWTEEGRDSGL